MAAHEANDLLEVRHCGDLSPADVVGDAAKLHGWLVSDAHVAERAVASIEELHERHRSVKASDFRPPCNYGSVIANL